MVADRSRQDWGALASSLDASAQRAEQSRLHLEAQVRELAEAQARLLFVVESLTGDAERQQSFSGRARAEALATVEKVIGAVDELQRTVEQEGDGASARLRKYGETLEDLRRTQSEDAVRLKSFVAELQRQQTEASARQRQCSDELAGACASLGAVRHEVSSLGQLVQRLDMKLMNWKTEVASEVLEELRTGPAEFEGERHRIEQLQREANTAAAARIELEARIEGLRVELSTVASTKLNFEGQLREHLQVIARRLEDTEVKVEGLRAEAAVASTVRGERMDSRMAELQQAFTRKVDLLHSGFGKDMEATRQELSALSQMVQRQEQRQVSLRQEVAKELRSAVAAREALTREEGALNMETFRREVMQQVGEVAIRIERLQVELTTVTATRESFEYRLREGYEELRKLVDAWQTGFREELAVLQRRFSTDLDGLQGGMREELGLLQRRLGAELRAETRALFKTEQNAIAALDEQLWLTDQRLGQRIDELLQAAGRGDRSFSAAPEVGGWNLSEVPEKL